MAIEDRAIIFETLALGDMARVSAIDSATGLEVTVIGPASAARHDLERLAKRKLSWALVEAGLLADDGDKTGTGGAQGGGAGGGSGTGRGKLI